jgi:DNA-binding response OmpR family regulator
MGEPLDLMILDSKMPGMPGYEVHRRLKEKGSTELPVIILTAVGQEILETEGWELCGVNYIITFFLPVYS